MKKKGTSKDSLTRLKAVPAMNDSLNYTRNIKEKRVILSNLKMKSLKSVSQQRKQEVKSFLSEGDAEFLFEKAKNGELYFRIGQVWRIPKRKGFTILICDYDGTNKIFHRMIRRRLKIAGVEVSRIESKRSPSGNGMHTLVWIRGVFTRWQCLALEGILESDPDKVAQDFRRAGQAGAKWGVNWHVLFKR